MTSWITSWLPPLPSIDLSSALPSAIQSRFISFVLKRTLGHFVKPGQFDVNQVDSQIGSGFVQVRDLRLDEDAINRLLQGIPLRLKEGSVASVMARVPWPNPMTSTIGMSVQSLHLTLSVVPGVKLKPPNSAQLAESVASVAETFIHEELSSKEEAMLRESIHSDAPGGAFPAAEEMKNIPGGFDVDVDPFHSPDAEGHEGVDRQFDPEGVGIFATLIEGLLSRFKFDARDVRITILDENNASFTLAVPDVQYTTESPESAEPNSQGGGVSRVLTVSGVTLSTRCLRPSRIRSSPYVPSTASTLSPVSPVDRSASHSIRSDFDGSIHSQSTDPSGAQPIRSRTVSPVSTHPDFPSGETPTIHSRTRPPPRTSVQDLPSSYVESRPSRTPSPASFNSSDSSTDEETQMMMSQSLAFLPPRPSELLYSPRPEAIQEQEEGSASISQSVASVSVSDIYSAYHVTEEQNDPGPAYSESPFVDHELSDFSLEDTPDYRRARPSNPPLLQSSSQSDHARRLESSRQDSQTPVSRPVASMISLPPPDSPEGPPSPVESMSSSQYHETSSQRSAGDTGNSLRSRSHPAATGAYLGPCSLTGELRPPSPAASVADTAYHDPESPTDKVRPPSPSGSVGSIMYQSAMSSQESRLHMPGAMWQSTVSDVLEDSGSQGDPFLSEPGHAEEGTSMEQGSPSIQVEERIPASASNPAEERQPSTPPTASPGSCLQEQMEAMEGDMILSFGSEPILMRLTTPSLRASSAQEANPPAPSASSKPRTKQSRDMKGSQKGNSQLSITVGVISVAISASHVQSILRIISQLPSSPSPRPTPARTPEPGVLDQLSVEASVRGVVCIVLLSPSAFADQGASLRMEEFFSHPLVPPKGIGNYLRLHLEALSLRISSSAAKPPTKRKTTAKIKPAPSATNATFELREISAFAYLRDNAFADDHSGYHIMPILITDPNLPSHCTSRHSFPMAGYPFQQDADGPELPTFDIMDWTDPRHRAVSSKINTWRTKAGTRRRSGHRSSSSPGLKSLTPLSPSSSRSDGHDTQDVTSEHRPIYAVKTTATLGIDVSAVRIDIAPLHFFLDLGLFSLHIGKPGESGLLSFLSQATSFEVNSPNVEDTQDSDEEDERDWAGETTPPATPRRIADVRESERERERKRLEALVLQDLDLSFDYRAQDARVPIRAAPKARGKRTSGAACRASRSPDIVLAVPMIRVQVRCPPTAGRAPRSGAIILDIHELELSMGPQSLHQAPTRARFAEFVDIPDDLPSHPEDNSSNEVLRAQWGRMLVSYAPVGDSKAMGILSLGPLSTPSETAFTSSAARPKHVLALLPRLRLMHSPLSSSSDASLPLHATVFAIDLPSAYVVLSKPIFDGIQLWADDITQLSENATRYWIQDADSSKATSLIGSRYFTRQGSSGAASDASPSSIVQPTRSSELVMKLSLSEGFVRIMLPRAMDQTGSPRPFDLCGSDLDLLIETKPEGKDETVMTLSVLNIGIRDLDATGEVLTMLSLTPLRDLASPTRPMLKLRFTSATVSDRGTAKESRVRLSLAGFTYNLLPDLQWASDLGQFAKAPPGAFDSMVPSERTQVSVRIFDGSVRLLAPTHPGAMVVHVGETEFNTDIVGGSPDIVFRLTVPELSVFMIDDNAAVVETPAVSGPSKSYWKSTGYALLCEVIDFQLRFSRVKRHVLPETEIIIQGLDLRIHLCADTIAALTAFISDFGTLFLPPVAERGTSPVLKRRPTDVTNDPYRSLAYSMDEHAFKRVPEVGAAPDMISDDLPTNPDYLDASFGAAAGFRELTDDDLDEFDEQDIPTSETPSYVTGIVSKVGGETIRMLDPEGIHIIEDYFETITPESLDESPEIDETTLRVRADDCNVSLFLYDGYDWARTRRIIEEEMKAMKRRLARIRQLIASGQTYDPHVEETSAVLFNSVYIGLEQDLDEMEPGAIIAAIDEELKEDFENETQSSWQSLRPQAAGAPATKSTRLRHRKLTRSKGPSIEIRLASVHATVDQYGPDKGLASRTFATVKDLEILDHIKTSTWRKFLSELITDSRGNMRETDSNMVRIELCNVRPVPGNPSEEARVKAKILPLRLNVDQDALDFFKKFFSFQDQEAPKAPPPSNPDEGIYIQYAEIFPVDLKLDYKPRRVDYRALKEGKTIELMNFFHFDGAEMTLRHLTLYGITGWPRLFDMLNDLWTPDVKATQMVDIISGVSPIRSVVNVGSGVADLVLLPIAQYKKDGRVIRGVQKGTSAFVRSTAMEAIKLGARLATGTQVILEQAENVLGGQFVEPLTMEALQIPGDDEYGEPGAELLGHDEEAQDLISRYAEQPSDIKEGIQSAYKSLRRNFSSAAQTILAVPMEVYERSGNEGPVRAVIRAVPIAVLKPMIGASEAVSKTLLGLQNTLDPSVRQEAEAKYKRR